MRQQSYIVFFKTHIRFIYHFDIIIYTVNRTIFRNIYRLPIIFSPRTTIKTPPYIDKPSDNTSSTKRDTLYCKLTGACTQRENENKKLSHPRKASALCTCIVIDIYIYRPYMHTAVAYLFPGRAHCTCRSALLVYIQQNERRALQRAAN